MKKLFRFLVLTTFFITTTNFLYAQWVQTNGPLGGAIQTFAFNSSGHIFVGTEGGIFRSTNNGINWKAVNNGLTNMLVNTLAVNSSGYLFAGFHGGGVYRSTNNGESWESMNNGVYAWVRTLVINSVGHIFAGTHAGVYCSSDNGATWAGINPGLTNMAVVSLAVNSQGYIFAATYPGGVYRSTDNGNSWIAINNGFTQTTIVQIAINLNGNIFARTYDGVFRSTDNGESWTHLNNNVPNGAWYLTTNSLGNVYVVSHGIYCSADNGENWTTVNSGFTNAYINVLAINSDDFFIAGTAKGEIFNSIDNGGNWQKCLFNFANTSVDNLIVNNSGDIFASTFGGGVSRSSDNGESWTQLNNIGGNKGAITPNGTIYMMGHLMVGRSTDNGESWVQISAPFANPIIRTLVVNSSGHLFAGFDTCGVYRSTDNGENWIAVNNGLTNKFILALAVNKNGDIFVETVGADIYRSIDNGENWTLLRSGLFDNNAGAIAINSKGDIFVKSGGIYRSTDNGESWTTLNTGLMGMSLMSLTIDSRDYIFAADYGNGVFFSANNGDSWTEVNTGLTNKFIWALATNPSDYIFAGTGGSGVWRRPLSEFINYSVTTSSNPIAGGSTSGAGTYLSGSNVTVSAQANNGYTFANWTEDGNIVSTSSNYTFTISGSRTLVANFTPTLVTHELFIPATTDPNVFLDEIISADNPNNIPNDPLRVYTLERGKEYKVHKSISNNGWTLRIKSKDGPGPRPVISITRTITGTAVLQFVRVGGDVCLKGLCITMRTESDPSTLELNNGYVLSTSTAVNKIEIDSCILSNVSGSIIRTAFSSSKISVTNSIFANMGNLRVSNFGNGRGVDLRDSFCDTLLLRNNIFVNTLDRVVRHFTSTQPLNTFIFDHNTIVNSCSYHGMITLGWVGKSVQITNNLFQDAFALAADTDYVRQSEFNESGEKDSYGGNRMNFISTDEVNHPSTDVRYTIKSNYYSVSATGEAWMNKYAEGGLMFYKFPYAAPELYGAPLTYHIAALLGADSVRAFILDHISLYEIPLLMTALMDNYRDPNGANKLKPNPPIPGFNIYTTNYDNKTIPYYRDIMDTRYSTSLPEYRAADYGQPIGSLLHWCLDIIGNSSGGANLTIAERYNLATQYIQSLSSSAFKKPADTRRKQLTDMLGQSKSKYISGDSKSASQYLEHNVLNHLSSNDKTGVDLWVTDATACITLTKMINELIDALQIPQTLDKIVKSDFKMPAKLEIPTEYALSQNYPNPFNPVTKIQFALPNNEKTRLVVYDVLGREIATIVNADLVAGYHEVEFNGSSLPSGIYIYKIQAGEFTSIRKMILIK